MMIASALFGWLASVEGGVFRLAVETGTVFGDVGEVAVADNPGLGIGLLEILQEEPEGGLLSGSAGVGIAAFRVFTTDVADADGVAVVVLDVGAGVFLFAALLDGAVLLDHPVIADHSPAFGTVAAVDVIDGPVLIRARAGAVYDDVQHFFHRFHFSCCICHRVLFF